MNNKTREGCVEEEEEGSKEAVCVGGGERRGTQVEER